MTLPPVRDATIRLEGVSYAYPSRAATVLDSVDLELRPGETVALVGASGSGKSTIASLLLGLAEPTRGRVTVDGVELATRDRSAWRRSLAWVPQQPTLFHGSVADNIRLGDPSADDDERRRGSPARRRRRLRSRAARRLRDDRRRRWAAGLGGRAAAHRPREGVSSERLVRHPRRADCQPRSRERRSRGRGDRAAGGQPNPARHRASTRARQTCRSDGTTRRRGESSEVAPMTSTLRRLVALAPAPRGGSCSRSGSAPSP